jgi:tRNA (guanine-N7-)-methyltransferase
LLVELESILEPLPIDRLFVRAQPLEVELGSGDGSFLIEYARLHPKVNFLGVERLLGRLRKLDRKGRRAHLSNLRGVQIECAYFLRYLLPPESCRAIHLYFPDPWPKRRQQKHRLVNEEFPGLVRRALQPGGALYLRTDAADYFAHMLEVFESARAFSKMETPPELLRLTTDFEREFNAKGKPTLCAAFMRAE